MAVTRSSSRSRSCRAGRGTSPSVVRRIFRVVVLDLARRQLAEALGLDLVDHRVEDVLARAEAHAAEHPDDHPLLVLARLIAEPDRRRLAAAAQLLGDHRRVEVERVHDWGVYEVSAAGRAPELPAQGRCSRGDAAPGDLVSAAARVRARPRLRRRPRARTRRAGREHCAAPSASALTTSVPRRIPPSTYTSQRPATASATSGSASSPGGDAVELPAAVVRDRDRAAPCSTASSASSRVRIPLRIIGSCTFGSRSTRGRATRPASSIANGRRGSRTRDRGASVGAAGWTGSGSRARRSRSRLADQRGVDREHERCSRPPAPRAMLVERPPRSLKT